MSVIVVRLRAYYYASRSRLWRVHNFRLIIIMSRSSNDSISAYLFIVLSVGAVKWFLKRGSSLNYNREMKAKFYALSNDSHKLDLLFVHFFTHSNVKMSFVLYFHKYKKWKHMRKIK